MTAIFEAASRPPTLLAVRGDHDQREHVGPLCRRRGDVPDWLADVLACSGGGVVRYRILRGRPSRPTAVPPTGSDQLGQKAGRGPTGKSVRFGHPLRPKSANRQHRCGERAAWMNQREPLHLLCRRGVLSPPATTVRARRPHRLQSQGNMGAPRRRRRADRRIASNPAVVLDGVCPDASAPIRPSPGSLSLDPPWGWVGSVRW